MNSTLVPLGPSRVRVADVAASKLQPPGPLHQCERPGAFDNPLLGSPDVEALQAAIPAFCET